MKREGPIHEARLILTEKGMKRKGNSQRGRVDKKGGPKKTLNGSPER